MSINAHTFDSVVATSAQHRLQFQPGRECADRDDWPTFKILEKREQEKQSALLSQIFPEAKSFVSDLRGRMKRFPRHAEICGCIG
jgi:hypothetical protein